MKPRIFGLVALATLVLGSAQCLAQNAYITNEGSDEVTVIDTRTNAVVGATIPVGDAPWGVAVAPDGGEVYVANLNSGTVSVIDARTNAVAPTFPAGTNPISVAVSTDGGRIYVANDNFPVVSTVTVIDASTGATIPTAAQNINSIATAGVAASPDGKNVYALNTGTDAIRVIDAPTNTIVGTITIPPASAGISITPDGAKLYVIGTEANDVTGVDTATNVATAVVPVGTFPISAGNFIQPAARFAGTRRTVTARVSRSSLSNMAGSIMPQQRWGSTA